MRGVVVTVNSSTDDISLVEFNSVDHSLLRYEIKQKKRSGKRKDRYYEIYRKNPGTLHVKIENLPDGEFIIRVSVGSTV